MVSGEAMAAGGADLAVMVYWASLVGVDDRIVLREIRLKIRDKVRVEGAGKLRQHA